MARGDLEVNITAIDRASDKIQDVARQAERLGDEEGEVVLRAEVKAAEKDLRRLRRELKDADGEEAEVRILADIDQAKRDIAALDGELDKIDGRKVEPEIEAPDAQGAGVDAGDAFGLGAIKGIGAAGIATAIFQTFQAGLDRVKMRAHFQNQFGLVKSDAKRLSKEAGDLYAANWGDSLGDVQAAIGAVQQQLVQTGQVSNTEMANISRDAIAVADTFDTDVASVIRSVSQLMLNGLAPDATTAMDIIVTGFQNGNDKAGDWLDTLNEYSQHFDAMGLSGEDALSIISHGMQSGQRDTDKLADAIKEMRIRATEDTDAISEAYESLGLNADEYRRKVAEGGDAARGAYSDILRAIDSVEDPVERQRVAVELIGTMYEDLGPKGLESLMALADGTAELNGATEDLVENVENATSQSEKFARGASSAWGTVSEAVAGAVNQTVGYWDTVISTADRVTHSSESIKGLWEDISGIWDDEAGSAASGLASELTTVHEALDGVTVGADRYAREQHLAARASEDHADAVEEQAEEIDDLTEAVEESRRSLEELRLAQLAQVNPTFAAMRATENHADALAELNAEGGNTPENLAAVVTASAEMEAAFLSAAEQADLTGDELYQMGIDAGLTEQQAYDLAVGVEVAKDRADEFAGEYSAELLADPTQANADIAEVNAAVDALDGKVANVRVRVTQEGQVRLNDGRGNVSRVSHTGSRFAAGESKYVVPGQVFTPDVGGRLSSVEESRRMTSAAGSSGGPPVHIHLADGRTVRAEVDKANADLLRSLEGGLR